MRVVRHDVMRTLLSGMLAAVLVFGAPTLASGIDAAWVGNAPICSADHARAAPPRQAPLDHHPFHACCTLGCCTSPAGPLPADAARVPTPRSQAARQNAPTSQRGTRANLVRAYAARAPPHSG